MRRWLVTALFLISAPATARPPSKPIPRQVARELCARTGQQAAPVVFLSDKHTTPRRADEASMVSTKVIGRVRDLTPLTLETVSANQHAYENPWFQYPYSELLAVDQLAVAQGLRFGDIVELTVMKNQFDFPVCGNDPSPPDPRPSAYVHAIQPATRVEPSLLVTWRFDRGQLEIYDDGLLQLREGDHRSRLQLSERELGQLFDGFAAVGFDQLPEARRAGSSINLACARDQTVDSGVHQAALAPLLAHLGRLQRRALADTRVLIERSDEVFSLTIVDWPADAIPLAELEDRQKAWKDRGKDRTTAKLHRKLPARLQQRLSSKREYRDHSKALFARDRGAVYEIWRRGCLRGVDCDSSSYAAVGVGLSAPIWPSWAPDLARVEPPGLLVDRALVDRHPGFFDGRRLRAVVGNRLYHDVRFSRKKP